MMVGAYTLLQASLFVLKPLDFQLKGSDRITDTGIVLLTFIWIQKLGRRLRALKVTRLVGTHLNDIITVP